MAELELRWHNMFYNFARVEKDDLAGTCMTCLNFIRSGLTKCGRPTTCHSLTALGIRSRELSYSGRGRHMACRALL